MTSETYLPRFPGSPDRDIPHATRVMVMERDNNTCQYCGATEALSIDHVFPWSNGGTHSPRNLVVACSVCNSIAGLRVFPEFAAKHDYVVERRSQMSETRLRRLHVLASAGRDISSFT